MSPKLLSPKLKDFLIKSRILTDELVLKLEDEIRKSGKNPEDYLVEQKIITPDKLAKIKGEVYNLPVADLSEVVVDHDVLNSLNQKVSSNYLMVVFDKSPDSLKVGMVNPDDFQAHDAIEFLASQQGLKATYYAISLEDFKVIYKQYSAFKKEIGTALESAAQKFSEKERDLDLNSSNEEIGDVIKTAPVAKIVSVIIRHAIEGGASDIHIEPGREESRVRYRVDGILHTSLSLPNYLHNSVVSRIKVMANLKLDETRVPQDGRIRMQLDNARDVDLRISVLPMLNAEKVVIRVLDNSAGIPTLAELGYNDYHIEIINRNMKKSFGLFLLTGPTGSGKTTTLYSILNMLNGENSNITTLEDPIEYYINGINQSQVNSEVGFTFSQGLRAILRQDPNIIMVGEIRDNETVELVIHAALTGHLVFSTLHTNNAWGSIPRLIDMKAEPFLLSSTLNMVMAQRLVRKVCPDCKKEEKIPDNLLQRIKVEIDTIPKKLLEEFKGEMKFYKGKGCSSCSNTGYIGRTVIGEVLELSPKMKNLISKEFTNSDAEKLLKEEGYVNLVQDGVIKALKGLTTVEEILRVAQS